MIFCGKCDLPIGNIYIRIPYLYFLVSMTTKIPCEIIVWYVLPSIRKELSIHLIEEHKLNQKEVAEKLGITEAAVSRYVSGKRGGKDIDDNEIINEIKKSASKIIKGDNTTIIQETCRICSFLKSKDFIEGINYPCDWL